MKSILTAFPFLMLFSTYAFSQVSVQSLVSSPLTINNLADSLTGSGIQVSNVTFTGANDALGYFWNGSNIIGMNSGIVMSSGAVSQINGNSNSNYFSSISMGQPGDADLTAVANVATFDATVLEMDFVSQGDSVEFQLVFASEEYPEYVCAFNDVFALLVSGNGYNGLLSNQAENVALIPGTTTPISINTIHNGNPFAPNCTPVNPSYYNDNSNQNYSFLFDGFTIAITVKFAVTPDSTYHFKIGIADALDFQYDSAIFLCTKSLKSNYQNTRPQLLASTSFGGTVVNERCGMVELNVHYPMTLTQNDTLEFITGGTATAGVDYGTFSSSVITLAGNTSAPTISIPILDDNLLENSETLQIYLKQNGQIIEVIITIIAIKGDIPFI